MYSIGFRMKHWGLKKISTKVYCVFCWFFFVSCFGWLSFVSKLIVSSVSFCPSICLSIPLIYLQHICVVVTSLYVCTQLFRDHSGYGLCQWEEALLCDAFSHWLNQYPECSVVHKQRRLVISLITAMWPTGYFPNNCQKLHIIILDVVDCCSGYFIKITGC